MGLTMHAQDLTQPQFTSESNRLLAQCFDISGDVVNVDMLDTWVAQMSAKMSVKPFFLGLIGLSESLACYKLFTKTETREMYLNILGKQFHKGGRSGIILKTSLLDPKTALLKIQKPGKASDDWLFFDGLRLSKAGLAHFSPASIEGNLPTASLEMLAQSCSFGLWVDQASREPKTLLGSAAKTQAALVRLLGQDLQLNVSLELASPPGEATAKLRLIELQFVTTDVLNGSDGFGCFPLRFQLRAKPIFGPSAAPVVEHRAKAATANPTHERTLTQASTSTMTASATVGKVSLFAFVAQALLATV